MERNMLDIQNVGKKYSDEQVALHDISLTIEKGEILGFVGPNGAGKTTLLKCVVGLLNQDHGTITINGKDRFQDSLNYKRCIGYVAEELHIFEKLKGYEFLNFVSDVYGVSMSERKEAIEKYSEYFELSDKLNNYISDYSHGMKQKIIIISAIIHNPNLLILDEPFVGLDPESVIRLKQFIVDYRQKGKAVLLSTHMLEFADSICDSFCFINHGKKVFYGKTPVYDPNKYKDIFDFYMKVMNIESIEKKD